jgi:hypothetical protein
VSGREGSRTTGGPSALVGKHSGGAGPVDRAVAAPLRAPATPAVHAAPHPSTPPPGLTHHGTEPPQQRIASRYAERRQRAGGGAGRLRSVRRTWCADQRLRGAAFTVPVSLLCQLFYTAARSVNSREGKRWGGEGWGGGARNSCGPRMPGPRQPKSGPRLNGP